MRYFIYPLFLAIVFFYCDAEPEASAEPTMVIKQIIIKKIYSKGKGLHEDCTKSSDCETNNSECINKKCSCSTRSKEIDGKCVEKISLNFPCVSCDEDPFCADEHSECFEGLCKCKQGYTNQDGVCVSETPSEGEILGACLATGNCTTDKSECSGGICECQSLHISVGPDCLLEKNYDEVCTYSSQCPENMFCNCNNACACIKGSVYTSEDTCEKISFTGEACSSSEQCSGSHTECIDKECACQSEYGPSNQISTDCVSKTTSILYGPFTLDNETLAYKEEYSDFNSTVYIDEAKPVLDFLITLYIDELRNNGLDVKEAEIFLVVNGTAGGSDVEILFTIYNPEYDKPTHRSRRSSLSLPLYDMTSKLNRQILRRTRAVLLAVDQVHVENAPDVTAVSQLGELCDASSDCDITGGHCLDRACICAHEFITAIGRCI